MEIQIPVGSLSSCHFSSADGRTFETVASRGDNVMAALKEIPFGRYYGSVDATPLFVMLAAAYFQRTNDLEYIRRLWPHIQAALDWIDLYGDPDGDGFIEYARRSAKGLTVQGWRDSFDAVFHADGSLAEGPVALAEVQGYVYAAKRAAEAGPFGEKPDISFVDRILPRYFERAPGDAPNVATAMIDVSDGLLADLGHILEHSGHGASIKLDLLPLSEGYREAIDRILNNGDMNSFPISTMILSLSYYRLKDQENGKKYERLFNQSFQNQEKVLEQFKDEYNKIP